jgi:predicted ribonuclease YlaK
MIVFDTNVLIENPELIKEYEEVCIPMEVLEELDKLKMRKELLGAKARKAVKCIKENRQKIRFLSGEMNQNVPDNKILKSVMDNWDGTEPAPTVITNECIRSDGP